MEKAVTQTSLILSFVFFLLFFATPAQTASVQYDAIRPSPLFERSLKVAVKSLEKPSRKILRSQKSNDKDLSEDSQESLKRTEELGRMINKFIQSVDKGHLSKKE